jgi:hypothetical protein
MEKGKKRHTKSYVRGNEMMIREGPANTGARRRKRVNEKKEKKKKVLSHYYKSVFIFILPNQKNILFNKRITRRMENEV